MTILKNIVHTRRYPKRDGSEGKEYTTVGQLHEGEHGQYITLYKHFNLAAFESKPGDNRATFSLHDPKPRDEKPARETRGRQPSPVEDSPEDQEIPF